MCALWAIPSHLTHANVKIIYLDNPYNHNVLVSHVFQPICGICLSLGTTIGIWVLSITLIQCLKYGQYRSQFLILSRISLNYGSICFIISITIRQTKSNIISNQQHINSPVLKSFLNHPIAKSMTYNMEKYC